MWGMLEPSPPRRSCRREDCARDRRNGSDFCGALCARIFAAVNGLPRPGGLHPEQAKAAVPFAFTWLDARVGGGER